MPRFDCGSVTDFVLASEAAGEHCFAVEMTEPDASASAAQRRQVRQPARLGSNRAGITRAACAALAVTLLAGCGAKPDDTFRILWRRGYVPEQAIAKFAAETGVKTEIETYSTDKELDEKLSARNAAWDVIEAPDHVLQALAKAGRLHKLDHAEIPNIANVDPAFTGLPFDPGCKFSVPYLAGFIGIVYNAETVTAPVVGFSDVFADQHTGRIVVPGDARETVSWAFLAAGIPINDTTDANIATVAPLLANWIPKVAVFDDENPGKAIADGEADIGIVDSGKAAQLFASNPAFQWVLPAEGFRMFVRGLAIPKTAPHRDAAEAFMNFMLRAETGKMISDSFFCYNPNAAARKLLSEQQLDNPASYPVGIDVTKVEMFSDIGAQAGKIEEVAGGLKPPPVPR